MANPSPYADGRVRRLADQLRRARVAPDTVAQILDGGEAIGRTTPPAQTARWLKGAMERLDSLVNQPTVQRVREGCACCLRGKRLEISRGIARDHATLEARLQAANEARFVFGHSVTQTADGQVEVSFQPPGWPRYTCPCLRDVPEPLPLSYCACCGGHAKHHLQIALGRRLACTVLSSALASGGSEPCTFRFELLD